eukprot:TRINITY_DN6853_c0_g1_i1.p1 TRINITY_DN6853_c0_g1~~TRINITY_DN6853_c0_g1_i1.p1  ORF type:complete len:530 (+),score=55.00 TRINITY_DN6853_c0_g1_i1:48-1637(+)
MDRRLTVVPASSSPTRGPSSPYRDPFHSSSPPRPAYEDAPGSSSPLRYVPPPDVPMQGTTIWGTSINMADFTQSFLQFLGEFRCESRLEPHYLSHLKECRVKHSPDFNVDAMHIYAYNKRLYNWIIPYPSESVLIMDMAVNQFYSDHFADEEEDKVKFAVRIFNLKDTTTMRNLQPKDIDTLVGIKGMITRLSKVIPEMTVGHFKCSECADSVNVRLHRSRLTEPARCTNCHQHFTYQLIHNLSEFENKQVIKLQEAPDSVPEGETPQAITVTVYGGLVDYVLPGDRVTITGIFRASSQRVASTSRILKSVFRTYLDALHISKHTANKIQSSETDLANSHEFISQFEEEPEKQRETEKEREAILQLAARPDIYQLLVRSMAPSIHALSDVKRGLLCQLFGGTNKNWSKSRVRGEINILLCGDPGVAKSQLLTYVNKIAPRGIYTSGRGSSSVGLTAYVVRDTETNDLVLESGALVLSDKGVCCIDEFDKMSEATRSILHEVMAWMSFPPPRLCRNNKRCRSPRPGSFAR